MQEYAHKYLLKLSKKGELRYISHLDWQNLIIKSLRRSGVKLVLSEGFSPSPKISFSPALPLFMESECELVNFMTKIPLDENFEKNFHNSIQENVRIADLKEYPYDERKLPSLDLYVQYAEYEAVLVNSKKTLHKIEDLSYNIEKCLSENDMFIEKINKKGILKKFDIKKSLFSLKLENGCVKFILKAGQSDETPAVRADDFIKALYPENDFLFNITRTHFFDKNMQMI